MPIFPSSGGTGVTSGVFPLTASGSAMSIGPWLNPLQVYASPTGNNSNDGLSWATPKLNGYNAAQVLVSAGGGTLNYADNTAWGGPVSHQGIWFRNDGLTVSGFLQ